MSSKYLLFFFFSTLLHAVYVPGVYSGGAVVPQDKPYYKYKLPEIDAEMIYTKDNVDFAKQTASIELPMNHDYEKMFHWKLDETLYIGLISDHNQIANGFSTQWPNNRQINYVGGAMEIDYFCSTSWLNTLLYHETAHNYQANIKDSKVSQTLHTLFGNGSFLLPITMTIPNITINSFMLEGNAVLNESWHGNGGRLYSGRHFVQTLLQAKANNITAAYVYNSRLAFPYGEIYYIQGGFYNLYLAQEYGLENVNQFFRYNSQKWFWPFLTSFTMEQAVGVNFETTLEAFVLKEKKLASRVKEAKGTHLVSSQFYYPLGSSDNSIFFITNESGVRAPELVVLKKINKNLTYTRDSWVGGKVLKVDGEYYTQAGFKTSPTMIEQGLFSGDGFIKEGSSSKVVQAYLSDGNEIYFDVASSYSEPQLYKGDTFYSQVNSSVIVDSEDNLYYFKQDKMQRTLYKNKKPLFTYKGFYGIVSDVDSYGRVYFIANSEYGSSVYRYDNGHISRVSEADNILDVRLLNDKELFISAVSDKDYYYVINKIEEQEGKPFRRELFFEKKEYYAKYNHQEREKIVVDLNSSYSSFLDMHYSGTDASFGLSTESQVVGSIALNFGDPLSQNGANVFLTRDESNITIAGAGYSSSQYLLSYSVSLYGVVDSDNQTDIRDYGVIATASLPLYAKGYTRASLDIHYFQDYDALEREPLSTSISIFQFEKYGMSMYSNFLSSMELYYVKEREDALYGGVYQFKHDLPAEFYVGAEFKYTGTNSLTGTDQRGVKLSSSLYTQDMDPSMISMPNISSSQYAKSVAYGEVNVAKVFNLSAYFFTFPISLQRESLSFKYRYYDIVDFADLTHKSNEYTTSLTLSTVFLNSLVLPVSFEYIYNDADFLLENEKFRFIIGYDF